jgi:YgiT-type zinc finger domain-containing protein
MKQVNKAVGFWESEICEYCGGALDEKLVTLHRKVRGKYILIENVPAGVCRQCGTRYYAANVLKMIEERVRRGQKASRQVLVPIYSL